MFESLDEFLQRLMVLVAIALITLLILRKLSEATVESVLKDNLTETVLIADDQIDGQVKDHSELTLNQESLFESESAESSEKDDEEDVIIPSDIQPEIQIVHLDKETSNTPETEMIEDEMQKELRKCACAIPLKMYRIGGNKYKLSDSKRICLIRILRSAVMVRVGGGWTSLEEFLLKHDPCRSEHLISYSVNGNFTQKMASFKPRRLVK